MKQKIPCKNCGNLCNGGKSGLCWVCRYKIIPGNRRGAKLTNDQLKKWRECKARDRNYWYGKHLSADHRKNISNSKTGKKSSKEFRKLQSAIRIKKLNKTPNGQWANYNKKACEFFNWLNMWMNWDGHHALHYGEVRVGWWSLDYYEPNYNIVIEWDEPYHYDNDGNLKSNDQHRQEQIKKRLNCIFYRIKESDVINGYWNFKSC